MSSLPLALIGSSLSGRRSACQSDRTFLASVKDCCIVLSLSVITFQFLYEYFAAVHCLCNSLLLTARIEQKLQSICPYSVFLFDIFKHKVNDLQLFQPQIKECTFSLFS